MYHDMHHAREQIHWLRDTAPPTVSALLYYNAVNTHILYASILQKAKYVQLAAQFKRRYLSQLEAYYKRRGTVREINTVLRVSRSQAFWCFSDLAPLGTRVSSMQWRPIQ